MAAILNGFLPLRKKDQYTHERILNTRWGDAAISAPIHGGWSATSQGAAQSDSSPDLERDLPPTPPHTHEEHDGVFILRDDEDNNDSEDETAATEKDNITITIPLPWKKKKSVAHSRKTSINNILNPRYAQTKRIDLMPPPLATAEAAAIPLPESRISSPIGRAATTSPVLSFRSRLASPSLGDILSPVAEGFAKSGPSHRPSPVLSPLQFAQSMAMDRPSAVCARRSSLTSYGPSGGMGVNTMTSQASVDEQPLELQRPPSRGLGTTAHMRASSRGPRAGSRGPRAPSTEPFMRRAPSVEPIAHRADTPQAIEPVITGILDSEPVRRRAPSAEPGRRRAPSIEPIGRRAPSIEPSRQRAPTVEPNNIRRAASREPRGRRRGASVEPRPKVRFHSEAPRPTHRPDSFSSNDGSIESDSEKDELFGPRSSQSISKFERDFNSTRRPRRRRSIASPISSPTAASFGILQPSAPAPPPTLTTNFDSIAARAGLVRPSGPPAAQRNPPRNRSQSRTRGLYADMHDDFRLLARDVHIATNTQKNTPATSIAPTPIHTQAPHSVLSPTSQPQAQRAQSPTLSTDPISLPSGIAAAVALRVEPERTGYSSDSSLTGLPSISNIPHTHSQIPTYLSNAVYERQSDTNGGKAHLAALARERKDQLRREERERAREKVARKLEKQREEMMTLAAANAFSDTESVMSGSGSASMSGSEKTRRVYGGSAGLSYDSDVTVASRSAQGHARGGSVGSGSGIGSKTMVPNAEEIWG